MNTQTNVNRILHSGRIKNGEPEPKFVAGIYRGFRVACLPAEFERHRRGIDDFWRRAYFEARTPAGRMAVIEQEKAWRDGPKEWIA